MSLRLVSPVAAVRLVKQAMSGKLVSAVVSVKPVSPFTPFTLVSLCQVRKIYRPVRQVASLDTTVRMTKSRWEVRHVSNINQVAQFRQVTQPLRLVGSALLVELFWWTNKYHIKQFYPMHFVATRSGRLIRAEFGVTQADSIVTTRELGL